MTDCVLDVAHVTKSYGFRTAVEDLSFRVAGGGITGFLGPNGAGKSTTLKMIIGILSPDAGHIAVFGRPLDQAGLARIGYLPEERGLYRKMTPVAIITHFARLKGLKASDARAKARALLTRYGLADAMERPVKALSKGMAQKVQILAAIAHDPDFLILDEPFSGLDPVNQQTLEDLVRERAAGGATVLFSTHVMQHAERLCDRVVMVGAGRKMFDGSVREAVARVPRAARIETDPDTDLSTALAGFSAHRGGEPGLWIIDVKDDAEAAAALARVVATGASVRRFEPTRASLHDAFVEILGPTMTAEDQA